MSSTKMDMNHPELKIKGATIVGMDKLPEPVETVAEEPVAEKPKKSKKKE